MFARDYRSVLKLRLVYDVEYAAGELHIDAVSESADCVRTHGIELLSQGRLDRSVTLARENLSDCDRVFAELIEARADRLSLQRVLRVAWHANYRRLRSRSVRGADRWTLLREIEQRQGDVTRKLIHLRMAHSLCRMHIDLYAGLLKELIAFPGSCSG